MYCSIQEAWPEHKFQNHRTNNLEYFKQDIHPSTSMHMSNNYEKNIHTNQTELFSTVDKCDSILKHIESCPYCTENIRRKYSQNKIIDIFVNNPQLQETILVFLIGIVILMILNILYK